MDKKERRKSALAEFFQGIRRGSDNDIRPNNPRNSVFGHPLDPNATSIHWIPQLLGTWLRKNGFSAEGVFRVSPSQDKLDALRADFEKQKEKIEIKPTENPHVVAGIFKLFFRELPEPLTSFAAYDNFLNVGLDVNMSDAERIGAMRRALGTIPPGFLLHVEQLADLLYACSRVDSNRMGVTNLSLIFAPLFFRAKVEEIKKMMRESPIVNMLTETLITNKDDLFKAVLLPNPPPKPGDGPMGYQIRRLTRSNTANSASDLNISKSNNSPEVPALNIDALPAEKREPESRFRAGTTGPMHSPVPQQRQMILSEARRLNRRSVAVMGSPATDLIHASISNPPPTSLESPPRVFPLAPSVSAAPSLPTAAAALSSPPRGRQDKPAAEPPISPMRGRATIATASTTSPHPRDLSPRGSDSGSKLPPSPIAARPASLVRPESPRSKVVSRAESPRSAAALVSPSGPSRRSHTGSAISPRPSSSTSDLPSASASRSSATDIARSSPPTAPLPSSPPTKSHKPAPPSGSPPRRRKLSQPEIPIVHGPDQLEIRIGALARGFRGVLQEQPSPEEVLALAKLLSAAQKGLMGAALDPTMYGTHVVSIFNVSGLSPELTLLRDRAVDGWEELTSRAAMRAKGARAGIDADLNALHSVLKLLQFYQRSV